MFILANIQPFDTLMHSTKSFPFFFESKTFSKFITILYLQ